MQPIILLAIVAVGAIAIGSGFLAPQIGNIIVQNIGVGDADLATPVDTVRVDLDVAPILNINDPNTPFDNYFDNKVVECSWHIGIEDLVNDETDINEVICKITDADNNAIAECNVIYPTTIDTDYPFSQHQFCNNLVEAYPGALLIDNVEDVRIVVRGDNPTIFEN
ncbi:MAG: hypothetical protein ACREAK_05630 [Nitrosarchaeum sp.]